MNKHRTAFTGIWTILTLALFVFPGFECRGFFMGHIISTWPIMMLLQCFDGALFRYENTLIFTLPILSGLFVFLCSWLMDQARITRKAQILLLISIAGGALFFASGSISYERWRHTPAISAAMESEIQYQPTRRDFYKSIVIPRALAGGMIGLYTLTALCTLMAAGMLLKQHIFRDKQLKYSSQSRRVRRE